MGFIQSDAFGMAAGDTFDGRACKERHAVGMAGADACFQCACAVEACIEPA